MIILDTNALSELARPVPEPRVRAWYRGQDADNLFVTAVTVAEIGYGVARLPPGRRKSELELRLDVLVHRLFVDRVLPFDQAAAERYGGLVASRERSGRPIDTADAQIAAICLHHGASLATRNVRDFDELGLDVVDPWEA